MKKLKSWAEFTTLNEEYTNKDVKVGEIVDSYEVQMYVQDIHTREEDFEEGDLAERIDDNSYYIVKEIPIKNIDIDEFYIDEDIVDEYKEEYEDYKSYPPIILGNKWNDTYTIIDGTHRVNALNDLGFETVICFVPYHKN